MTRSPSVIWGDTIPAPVGPFYSSCLDAEAGAVGGSWFHTRAMHGAMRLVSGFLQCPHVCLLLVYWPKSSAILTSHNSDRTAAGF